MLTIPHKYSFILQESKWGKTILYARSILVDIILVDIMKIYDIQIV